MTSLIILSSLALSLAGLTAAIRLWKRKEQQRRHSISISFDGMEDFAPEINNRAKERAKRNVLNFVRFQLAIRNQQPVKN